MTDERARLEAQFLAAWRTWQQSPVEDDRLAAEFCFVAQDYAEYLDQQDEAMQRATFVPRPPRAH